MVGGISLIWAIPTNLTLEYLELVILQQVGYAGTYRSRTGMFNVKSVPWAGDVGDSDDTSRDPSEFRQTSS